MQHQGRNTQQRPGRERVLESVIAPIYFRHLLSGGPLDDDFVTGLVDVVAAGAGAGS